MSNAEASHLARHFTPPIGVEVRRPSETLDNWLILHGKKRRRGEHGNEVRRPSETPKNERFAGVSFQRLNSLPYRG